MPRRPTDSKNWGGARPGAGRPRLVDDGATCSTSLPRDLLDRYTALAAELGVSRSAVLRAAAVVASDRRIRAQVRKEQENAS